MIYCSIYNMKLKQNKNQIQHTDLQRGTFKSTLIKTFCPSRSTLSANPSTLSLARSAPVAWKKREERADADLQLVRERVDAARENMDAEVVME